VEERPSPDLNPRCLRTSNPSNVHQFIVVSTLFTIYL
jgi:hypothetical protein